ncbi:MAG TPA: hypothetical protein PLE55_11800, partial [Clostridiales bacterium]|nr:hypothetical protein [Clostridiales bacterium]
MNIGILGFAHGHIGGLTGEWMKHPEYGVSVICGWDHDESRRKKNCADLGAQEVAGAESAVVIEGGQIL